MKIESIESKIKIIINVLGSSDQLMALTLLQI